MCHCKVLDYDYSWAFKLRTSLRMRVYRPLRPEVQRFLSIQAQDFIEDGKIIALARLHHEQFLSIQAQDFIEDIMWDEKIVLWLQEFLSIQAQDFIEDRDAGAAQGAAIIPEHSSSGLHWGESTASDIMKFFPFLSIQAQDFIEDRNYNIPHSGNVIIPEHSSSGLHWGNLNIFEHN